MHAFCDLKVVHVDSIMRWEINVLMRPLTSTGMGPPNAQVYRRQSMTATRVLSLSYALSLPKQRAALLPGTQSPAAGVAILPCMHLMASERLSARNPFLHPARPPAPIPVILTTSLHEGLIPPRRPATPAVEGNPSPSTLAPAFSQAASPAAHHFIFSTSLSARWYTCCRLASLRLV